MSAQLLVEKKAVRDDGVLDFAQVSEVPLESGAVLPEVTIAFETWGRLNEDASNAVLVLHALTGDTHVSSGRVGPEADLCTAVQAAAPGWWEGTVGPGCVIDTDRYFVVAPNILGGCYGSTGPSSPAPASVDPSRRPWGSRFPRLTVRDTVVAEKKLAQLLGIERFQLVIGGSLGGMRALEWALMYPEAVASCAVIASGPSATADQLAWAQAQDYAITMDPNFAGGDYYDGRPPTEGLGLARRIAHTTYRSAAELHHRFGRDAQDLESPLTCPMTRGERGRFKVESYLDHHARKITDRFDANSYLVINGILRDHDVTRGRGSLRQAMARSQCRWTIAAVDSDRLFYPSESEVLAAALPEPTEAILINSPSGHDGFLIESEQVKAVLQAAVAALDE